jgi:hypothetical protein
MSEAPTLEPEAARLYQQMLPVAGQDAENGFVLAHLCAVLMAPIERVARIALDHGEQLGYSSMLDIDAADTVDLAWLGQFDGVALAGSQPDGEQRRMIREARGSHRGKPEAIVSDLQATLTGSKHVEVAERVGGPLRNSFVVQTRDLIDEAVSQSALEDRATKPLGTINTLVVSDDAVWATAANEWSEVAGTVKWSNVKNGDV